MTRMVNSRTYARVRGIFGGLFVVLGVLIVAGAALFKPFNLNAMIQGGLLGTAMILLGIFRIRGAIATWKAPPR